VVVFEKLGTTFAQVKQQMLLIACTPTAREVGVSL